MPPRTRGCPIPELLPRPGDVDYRPTFYLEPPSVGSYLREAVEFAAQSRLSVDPWQQFCLRGALGYDDELNWSAPEVALILSRQNGKGTALEVKVLFGVSVLGVRRVIWTAQVLDTTIDARKRLAEIIQSNPDLDREVKTIRTANGMNAIEFFGASRRTRLTELRAIEFRARSKDAGRGLAGVEILVYDEAYGLTQDQMAASLPTLGTVRNCQVIYTSTPPLDTLGTHPGKEQSTGSALFALRERAYAGAPGLAYYEYAAGPTDPDTGMPIDLDKACIRDASTRKYSIDIDDRGTWSRVNPSSRLQVASIERERRAMSRRSFLRERLGVWPPAPVEAIAEEESQIIDDLVWDALEVMDDERPTDIALAIDAEPSRGHGVIMIVGGRTDGRVQIEVAKYAAGIEWIVDDVVALTRVLNPICVAIDGRGPASSLIPKLQRAGLVAPKRDRDDPGPDLAPKRGDLFIATTMDVANATAGFIDAANAATGGRGAELAHRGDQELLRAISGLKTREIGDGMQAFARRVSSIDISPAVAASLGCYARAHRLPLCSVEYDVLANIW